MDLSSNTRSKPAKSKSSKVGQTSNPHARGGGPGQVSLLGQILLQQGNFEEALKAHGNACKLRRKLFGNDNPEVAASLSNIADVYKKKQEACRCKEQRSEDPQPERSVAPSRFLVAHAC